MIDVEFPKLYPWQKEVFDAVVNDDCSSVFCTKARRQCGKSIVAITILLYFAFRNDKSVGTCVEPTIPQARLLFAQLLSAVGGTESPLIKKHNETFLEVTFVNDSRIIFRSAAQGDGLRGITIKRSCLVIDEAAFIPKEIFEILYPVVDAMKCPVLMISTPQFEDGEFYEKFILGKKGDKYTKSFDWAEYDTSALLSNEKLEYYRRTMNPLRFKTEYLSEFLSDKSFVFGDFTKCYGYSSKPPKYAGIDWASGKNEDNDYSCMVLMDEDGKEVATRFFKVIDAMDLVDELAGIINATPTLVSVVVEDNSIGEIYRSALKRKLNNKGVLKSFNTSNTSKRKIIEQLIEAFHQGAITIIENQRSKEQLQHYQIEETATGKITYNSANGYNDDYCIALALAYDTYKKYKNNRNFRIGFG